MLFLIHSSKQYVAVPIKRLCIAGYKRILYFKIRRYISTANKGSAFILGGANWLKGRGNQIFGAVF